MSDKNVVERNKLLTETTLALFQEYLTGPLDKKPARQAGIELAGKVKHLIVNWKGCFVNTRLAGN